jgi:hypothetical protein
MGQMKTHIIRPFRHILQITLFDEKRSSPEKDIGLIHAPPDIQRTLEGLLKGRFKTKTFPERPDYLRYSDTPRAGMGAPGTVSTVADEAMISPDLLPHKKRNKDILGINIEIKVVGCTDRCTDLAAKADREVLSPVAGMHENYFLVLAIHRLSLFPPFFIPGLLTWP